MIRQPILSAVLFRVSISTLDCAGFLKIGFKVRCRVLPFIIGPVPVSHRVISNESGDIHLTLSPPYWTWNVEIGRTLVKMLSNFRQTDKIVFPSQQLVFISTTGLMPKYSHWNFPLVQEHRVHKNGAFYSNILTVGTHCQIPYSKDNKRHWWTTIQMIPTLIQTSSGLIPAERNSERKHLEFPKKKSAQITRKRNVEHLPHSKIIPLLD